MFFNSVSKVVWRLQTMSIKTSGLARPDLSNVNHFHSQPSVLYCAKSSMFQRNPNLEWVLVRLRNLFQPELQWCLYWRKSTGLGNFDSQLIRINIPCYPSKVAVFTVTLELPSKSKASCEGTRWSNWPGKLSIPKKATFSRSAFHFQLHPNSIGHLLRENVFSARAKTGS